MFRHWHLIRRLFPYMRPYRGRALGLVALTILATIIGLFQPWPLAFMIDSVLGDKPYPGFLGFLTDAGVTKQILFTVLLGFVFVVVSHSLDVATRAVDTRLELGMVLDFRSDLFEHIQKLSFQYHDQAAAGRFIYQINYFAHDAGSIPTAMLPLAQAGLTLLGMFAITYQLEPQLALAATAVVPLVYSATMFYGKQIEPKLLAVRELEGKSISIVHEKISIVRVVVSFCRERYELARFREQGAIALDARVRITIRQTVFSLGVGLITAAGTGLVLFIGAHAVRRGSLSIGELLVVLAYVAAVYQPIEQIANSLAGLQQQLIQMEMVFGVLDAEPDVKQRPDALTLTDVQGRIEIDSATFNYKTRKRTIEDVSLTVAPGEFVAIVGPTGAGKSTLVSLIPRFIDPHRGRVLIDGHDVRDLTLESVRGAVSVVMQEPILFMGTIADNIRYGHLDATDDEVVAAATAANAHEFIMQLPDGYLTTVGERGARVSGGERQRIAVARAFLKNAPILVLDEPTSSIDSRTEAVILDALERLAEGRTTILIAHRLSTIRSADRIVVVDDGRIVEQGTHDELIELGGMYQSLWQTQTGSTRTAATGSVELAETMGAAAPAVLNRRPKVVVLGMMSKIPVAGVVWQTMHYLVGLERLGIDAYYVEAHARTPSMFMTTESDDASKAAAGFIADAMDRFGLSGRWAFHALHNDGAVYGMTAGELNRLYADADLIINLHGGTVPLTEHAATGRLIYVETDPVQLQIELAENNQATFDFLEPHVAFFTFGENYGQPGCGLPVSDRFPFLPTRQPVVVDFWDTYGHGPEESFTTIGNWRQPWREVTFNGETYHWTKHLEFLKFLSVPERTNAPFELALSSYTDDDKAMLESHGWQVVPALDLSLGLDSYRRYIGGSRGEFTVAKDQNIRLRTGWFSDRSATYLAVGRPVITQDTGFGDILPTGEGLFAFSTLDDVAAAVEAVNADYARHRRAARSVACEYFDSGVVLGPLLDAAGLSLPGSPQRPTVPSSVPGPLRTELDLTVTSRHPTTMSPATVVAVMSAPPPAVPAALDTVVRITIVIATFDNLVFTRLCLATVLANTDMSGVEIVVVDNGSTDGSVSYVGDLAERSSSIRLIRNETNLGFAAAVNQGLSAATGELFVLLNNDTLVAPGWLDHLEHHLADPDVGMVGPLTNEAPNEARTTITYTTYGGYLDAARQQRGVADGECFDIDVLTMFCVMFRRATYEQVGPLDEQFEIGMFEDDDYSMRLRGHGFRVVCAGDVLVHHFGEATIGKLVAGGEYSRVFDANRRRFEDKWGSSWTPHEARHDPAYLDLVRTVVEVTAASVPGDATVLMVSKGDERLLDIPGRTVWHFPRDDNGDYAGWYAADTAEVLAGIDREIARGVTHVVFPEPASWWFDFYTGLGDAFADRLDEIDGAGVCRIFAVRDPALVAVLTIGQGASA